MTTFQVYNSLQKSGNSGGSSLPSIPLLSLTTPAVIRQCENLQDCETGKRTLFIASYPKSGTTWMQAIVYNLISDGKQDFTHISHYSPFFEIAHTWNIQAASGSGENLQPMYRANHDWLGWRVFNTHLRWEMMPKLPSMKYIYVVRNGKDVALSFYKHLSNQADADQFDGALSEFLEQWLDGQLPFGHWLYHLHSWVNASGGDEKRNEINDGSRGSRTSSSSDNHRGNMARTLDNDNSSNSSNSSRTGETASPTCPVLIVRYADMVHNLPQVMWEISVYLELQLSRERVEELAQYVTFDYMKAHANQYQPISVPWKAGYHFLRKGIVGDSANYFTPELDQLYERALAKQVQVIVASEPADIPDTLDTSQNIKVAEADRETPPVAWLSKLGVL